MNRKNICKSCSGSIKVSEDYIQSLIKEADLNKFNIVSDELYKARVEICKQCSSFQYGTTCSYSGSIIHYQAKFKSQTCPYPRESKWAMITI
jgi:hypothetical protein